MSYGPSAAQAMRGYSAPNVGISRGLASGSSGPMVVVPRAQPQAPIGLTTAGEQLVNRNRPRNQAAINQMERLHNRGAVSAPNLDFRVLNGNTPAIKPKDRKVRFADSPGNTDEAKTARKGPFGERASASTDQIQSSGSRGPPPAPMGAAIPRDTPGAMPQQPSLQRSGRHSQKEDCARGIASDSEQALRAIPATGG